MAIDPYSPPCPVVSPEPPCSFVPSRALAILALLACGQEYVLRRERIHTVLRRGERLVIGLGLVVLGSSLDLVFGFLALGLWVVVRLSGGYLEYRGEIYNFDSSMRVPDLRSARGLLKENGQVQHWAWLRAVPQDLVLCLVVGLALGSAAFFSESVQTITRWFSLLGPALIAIGALESTARNLVLARRSRREMEQPWRTSPKDLIQVSPQGSPCADGSDLVGRTQESLGVRLNSMIANLGFEVFFYQEERHLSEKSAENPVPEKVPPIVLGKRGPFNSLGAFAEPFLKGVYRNVPFAEGRDEQTGQFFRSLRQELDNAAKNDELQGEWGCLKLVEGELILARPTVRAKQDEGPRWKEAAIESPRGVYRPRKPKPEAQPVVVNIDITIPGVGRPREPDTKSQPPIAPGDES